MFKDINIFIDDEKVEYQYEVKDHEIICSIPVEQKCFTIDIVYDENVYDIYDISYEVVNAGKISLDLNNIHNNILNFKLEINYKYFIKSIYKYLNKLIDKTTLIGEINLFKDTKNGEKYQRELISLIDEIDEKSLDDLLLSDVDENERIENILLNNQLYISLAKNMTDLDLMLLITNYIYCQVVPKIDQDKFNDLVKSAINYDHSLENIWRLGMNYDDRGYDFDLLDKFFVDSKDAWYLSEYISSISQVNQEKIVKLVVEKQDKEFIHKLLEDNFIQSHLEEKYQQTLKDTL